MKPKRCLLFTCLIVGFLFFNACNKEDINTNTGSWSGQALNADTLYFDNETQFRDFLFHYGLSRKYEIIPPKYHFSCTVVPLPNNYPEQMRDDYLNEDRFVGKPFINLFDHIATRKYINIFFRLITKTIPAQPRSLIFVMLMSISLILQQVRLSVLKMSLTGMMKMVKISSMQTRRCGFFGHTTML